MKTWVIVLLTVLVLASGAALAWQTFSFSQRTPALCKSCHLMQTAYDTWSHSAHKDIECHTCHRASIAEQNRYLISTLIRRPKEVPARHGRVIVPRSICLQCHWDGDPKIPKVNASAGHSLHAFTQNIECTKCHAQEVHKFLPDSKVCAQCHAETVKAKGMENHDCQLCHHWKAEPGPDARSGHVPGLPPGGEARAVPRVGADGVRVLDLPPAPFAAAPDGAGLSQVPRRRDARGAAPSSPDRRRALLHGLSPPAPMAHHGGPGQGGLRAMPRVSFPGVIRRGR